MKLFKCFNLFHGQSSNPHIYESPERNTPTGSPTFTVLSNSPENRISRMLGFSTSLTPDGLPDFTQMFRQPKTPMQSRITSPKKVIIVNPDSTRCLGEQRQIKTTCTTTPSMQLLRERLSTLSGPETPRLSSSTITM
uniref:Ac4 n=2 Tax=Tomato common mosaic virus TaxID=536084 RepID=A0A0U4IGM4_9GEMI|nr:C4 [Tomato common mosaic virus]QID57460.1 AC4 protein [Tomato common mosaic virus]QID57465.1 AC4 protein [Tomato common mosaic virus]QID57470.1 AC4 protein [Tomato common mosaic virus]QNO58425.1 ac4 [Tomato common mosaic virus]